jgi:hypothetical protein
LKIIKRFMEKIFRSNKPVAVEIVFDLSLFFFFLTLIIFIGKAIVFHQSGGLVANRADLISHGMVVLVIGLIARVSLI